VAHSETNPVAGRAINDQARADLLQNGPKSAPSLPPVAISPCLSSAP
jgi:hypothetical protein